MKYAAVFMAALVGSFSDAHKLEYNAPGARSASNDNPMDLYSFTEKDNVNQEIAEAKQYMERQKKAEEEAARKKKIDDAYAAIEKENQQKIKAEQDRVQKIMSLAEKVDQDY